MRFGPQTSWPGLAMMKGTISGAAAGGPQPARSSGGAGAVAQAAAPEPGGEVGGTGDELGAGEQAAATRLAQTAVAASASVRAGDLAGMPEAYPPIGKDGVAQAARIGARHPEDP